MKEENVSLKSWVLDKINQKIIINSKEQEEQEEIPTHDQWSSLITATIKAIKSLLLTSYLNHISLLVIIIIIIIVARLPSKYIIILIIFQLVAQMARLVHFTEELEVFSHRLDRVVVITTHLQERSFHEKRWCQEVRIKRNSIGHRLQIEVFQKVCRNLLQYMYPALVT